jgi:hypothetical protein
MWLPGENAKKNRSIMVNILVRYFAGDKSLLKEIEANAASDSPVAQMARASLASERVDSPLKLARKRPFEELEFEERKAALALTKIQIETGNTAVVTQKITLYSDLCSAHPHMDERARLILKDLVLNLLTRPAASGQLQIADGSSQPTQLCPGSFLTISEVATDLGYRFNTSQLTRVGGWIAKAYFRKYNATPPKHSQFVDGAARKVNTYQSKDRDILEAEIRRFAKEENIAARF